MSEHGGRGSWCNAGSIAMETDGGKSAGEVEEEEEGIKEEGRDRCFVLREGGGVIWGGGWL